MSENWPITGADVAELRRRRGYTLQNLADILGDGTTPRVLGLIETGGAWLNAAQVDKLILLGAVPGAGRSVTPAVEPTPVPDEQTPPIEHVYATPMGPIRVDHEVVGYPEVTYDHDEFVAAQNEEWERDESARPVRRISNSEVQTFKRCRRKWWLAWHRGLTPRVESPVGVRQVGNRIHRAMEVGYAPGGPHRELLLASLERFIVEDREAAGVMDFDTQAKFESEANLERIMLEGYVDWLEETGEDENLDVLSSEQYVEVKLTELSGNDFDVYIIGRLDVMVRRKSDGAIAFIDHKTVGAFTDLILTLPLNEQSKHYQLLQWMTHPAETRVTGVIFNYLRRVKRTARATPPFYMREGITHSRIAMENYYDRLMGELRDILRVEAALRDGANHQEVAYPTVIPDRCRWECPFVRQCAMFDDGSRVEEALAAQFVVGDPLSYYDRKEGEVTE